GLAAHPNPREVAPFVRLVARSLTDTLTTTGASPVLPDLAKLEADDPERQGYFYVPDETDHSRHILLIRVHPKEDYSSLTALSETVEAIRDAVADTIKLYPEFEAGITGRPALAADEMRTTDTD